jgi:hypothetical protein
MATMIRAGEEVSAGVSGSFDEYKFVQVLLAGPATISRESSHISPRPTELYVDEPYFVPNICRVAESTVSLRPCMGLRKERHTIQIQNEENLRNGKLNLVQRRKGTDHDWYLCTQGQYEPDYTLEGGQHPTQVDKTVFNDTCW